MVCTADPLVNRQLALELSDQIDGQGVSCRLLRDPEGLTLSC